MGDPLLVNLSQMIDLALGSPDYSIINFNILHALLHVISNHLNLNNSHIEMHGPQAQKAKKMMATITNDPTINLTEYEIKTKGNDRIISKRKFPRVNEIVVVVRGFGEEETKPMIDEHTEFYPEISNESIGSKNHGGSNQNLKQATKNNQTSDKTNNNEDDNNQISNNYDNERESDNALSDLPTSIVSREDYKKLEKKVDSISDLMSVALPNTYETENADGTVSPLNERLKTNEKKFVKLAEVTNELIYKFNALSEEFCNVKDNTLAGLLDRMDETTKVLYDNNIAVGDLKLLADKKQTYSSGGGGSVGSVGSVSRDKQGQTISKDTHETQIDDNKKETDSNAIHDTKGYSAGTSTNAKAELSVNAQQPYNSKDFLSVVNEIVAIKATIEILKNPLQKAPEKYSNQEIGHSSVQSTQASEQNTSNRGSNVDVKYVQRQTERKFEIIESKMETLERQVFNFEKEISEISDKIHDFVKEDDGKAEEVGVADLYSDLNNLKKEFDSFKAVLEDATHTTGALNVSVESFKDKLEDLEYNKVNKEEIDELLADKADYNLLQGKVSVEQFDAVRKEWGDSLIDAKIKLNDQELYWQEAMKDIQNVLQHKLDKDELSPLKDHINKKLQAVQERLKALAALKRDPEAAGTKTRFLRDVNCLSCERDVIMRMEEAATVPKTDLMPPTKSLKPFLTYELDIVRKQINNLGNSRNMHHFEDITRDDYVPTKRNEKEHLCSRFCGGSHTTLTPYDRVTKTHFERNKKEMSHDTDYYIKGNDGTMYKGTIPPCKCEKPLDKEIQVIEEVKQMK